MSELTDMTELRDLGRTILGRQPFSAWLGVELVEFDAGVIKLSLAVRDELKQHHGFVHGGVISSLADIGLTFAGGSALGDCVSSEFKVNFLRPAQGERLAVESSVLSSGARHAVCECRIRDIGAETKLAAAGQGTIVKVGHD